MARDWMEELERDPRGLIGSLRRELDAVLGRYAVLEAEAEGAVVRWERTNWSRSDLEPYRSEREGFPRPATMPESVGDRQGTHRIGYDVAGRIRVEHDFLRTFVPAEGPSHWTAKKIVEHRDGAILVWDFSHDHPRSPRRAMYLDVYPVSDDGRVLAQIHLVAESASAGRSRAGGWLTTYDYVEARPVRSVQSVLEPDAAPTGRVTVHRYLHDRDGLLEIVREREQREPLLLYRRPPRGETHDTRLEAYEETLMRLIPEAVAARTAKLDPADPVDSLRLHYYETDPELWLTLRLRSETEDLGDGREALFKPTAHAHDDSHLQWWPGDDEPRELYRRIDQELKLDATEAWRLPHRICRVVARLNREWDPTASGLTVTDRFVVYATDRESMHAERNLRLAVPFEKLLRYGIRFSADEREAIEAQRAQLGL